MTPSPHPPVKSPRSLKHLVPAEDRLLGRTRRRPPRPMTSVQVVVVPAAAPRAHQHQGKRASMATFMTIGYGDRAGYKATTQAVRDA